jgi:hypothetical protein
LFFLAINLFGLGGELAVLDAPSAGAPAAVRIHSAGALETQDWLERCLVPEGCDWAETLAARAVHRLSGAEGLWTVGQRLSTVAPYALFLMLPVFASLMKLAWRRSGLPYGAHFVFGLHQHAFCFLVLLASAPMPEAVTAWAMLLMFVHGVVAMHRVYGGRWPSTMWRALSVALLYGLALLAVTVAISVAVVLLA